MKRRGPEYRHTAALSHGEDGTPEFWAGDVTLVFTVARAFAATHMEPGSGAVITDWRIEAVDRRPVSEWPDPAISQLVEQRWEELEPELLAAAAEEDAYRAEEAADWRREAFREERP